MVLEVLSMRLEFVPSWTSHTSRKSLASGTRIDSVTVQPRRNVSHVGFMQCSGLLEARRCAWQYCSTSMAGHPTISQYSRKLSSSARSPCITFPRARRRTYTKPGHSLYCHAQSPGTKEREAERDVSLNGSSQNGSRSNGSTPSGENGSAKTKEIAQSGGPEHGLGTAGKQGEKSPATKGTLDHLLETSKQVEPSNSARPTGDQEGLGENDITPASSWLPYSPVASMKPSKGDKGILGLANKVRKRICRVPEVVTSFVTFRIQQLMLSNTIVKLSAVFLFATPAVLIGGEVYSVLTGSTPLEGFLKIYSVLYIIPGVNVLAESDTPSFILVNAIFLLGTFTFAVVLGVVSDDIGNELKAIRSGNYPVVIKDHVLILNWNRQTPSLLRQLALACKEAEASSNAHVRNERGIVVLAQQDKSWMDIEAQQALRGYNISWQTREGAPYSANDLARVSAGSAETIILMRPEKGRVKDTSTDICPIPGSGDSPKQNVGENIAAQEVAALLGINAQRENPGKAQNIIVQAPEDSKDVVAAAKRVISQNRVNALGLRDQRDMTRLIAQSALQPGVASVQCAILQKAPGSVSFHLCKFNQLEGLEYEEVRRRFSGAVVCGVVRNESFVPLLNPAADEKMEKDDRIIALSPEGRIFAAKDEWAPEYQKLGELCFLKASQWNPPAPKVGPRKVVVAGWCGEVEDLTASLTMFAPQGTDVTMVCECAPEGMPTGTIDGINFFHLPGHPHNTMCLEEAGVADADAIIIGPADDLDSKEADAQMLSELMLVQDILIASGRDRSSPAHVVAVVRCPHTVKVANYMVRDLSKGCMTCELLQPDELVSGLIAQVSSEPRLAALLSQIIDSAQGIQVRLREPGAFQLEDTRAISFAEVAERARALQETALGFITRQGALVLAPPAGSTHVFRNTDRVVVFAGKQDESDGLEWAGTRKA